MKKIILCSLLSMLMTLSLLVSSAFATIAIDSVTENSGDASSFIHSHTVSGLDTIIIVEVALDDGDSDKSVTNIKYAGIGLTRLTQVNHNEGEPRADVWYLVNPPAGTNNVQVNLQNDNKASIGVISFTGVDQTTPIDGVTTAQGTNSNPSVSVPSTTGDLVVDVMASVASDSPTVGPGQTQRWNEEMGGNGASDQYGAGSTEAGASSVNMGWSLSESKEWAMIGFNLNELAAPECSIDNDCNDDLFCNGVETCQAGVCQSGNSTDCSVLNDQCTVGVCDEATDSCVEQSSNEGLSCNDGLFCNQGETCQSGVCAGGSALDCVGGNNSCVTGSCNEATDSCNNSPVLNGTPCSDGQFCTINDVCIAGLCGGSARDCSDSVSCTVDSCNEISDSCVNAPDNTVCNDGSFCNGAETCDAVLGCQSGTPPVVDDGVGCTVDSCNEANSTVFHVPDNSICQDSLFCNGNEVCDVLLDCQAGTPVVCNDSDVCTTDSCNEINNACEFVSIPACMMTPEIDSVTTNSGDQDTFTHSHTIAGSNRLLVVEVALDDGASDKAVTNVKYAGIGLTRLTEISHIEESPRADVWYLVNPPTGTSNVQVNLRDSNKVSIGVISFTGVDQTTPIDGVTTAQGTNSNPSVSVPSTTGDLVVDIMASVASDSPAVGPDQTQRWNEEMGGNGASDQYGAGSTEDGASSVNMGWSLSEPKEWAMIGFNLNAG